MTWRWLTVSREACRTGEVGRALAVSVLVLGCAGAKVPSPSAPPTEGANVCRGSRLDVDAALTRCTVHEAPRPVPSGALRVGVVPSEIEAETGRGASIAISMTNATTKLLILDLVIGCEPFEVSTYAADGRTRVDLSEPVECPRELPAGVSEEVACRPGDPVRVTLEPGGRLVKHLDISAFGHRFARWRGACVRQLGSAFAPGHYVARVRLPILMEPSSVEVQMNVTRHQMRLLGDSDRRP
jgi:hypothetical protein